MGWIVLDNNPIPNMTSKTLVQPQPNPTSNQIKCNRSLTWFYLYELGLCPYLNGGFVPGGIYITELSSDLSRVAQHLSSGGTYFSRSKSNPTGKKITQAQPTLSCIPW